LAIFVVIKKSHSPRKFKKEKDNLSTIKALHSMREEMLDVDMLLVFMVVKLT